METPKRGCVCGNPTKRPHTRAFVEALSELRGYPVKVCPLCGHEIGPIVKAHDWRKLSAFGFTFAHRACVKARGLTPKPAKEAP